MSEGDPLRCVRTGDPWRVREIAEALEDAGITCQVDTYPPGGAVAPLRGGRAASAATQMGVYVAPGDFEAAHERAEEYERSRMPDVEAEQPVWDGDPGTCPGCSTAVPPEATSCAECGLEFPSVAQCPRCGSLSDPETASCAVCGSALGA
jgi:hypothetical protein